MSMVGLMGAHRTGKTSLARAYAQENSIDFLETSVSSIFRDFGYDSSAEYAFKDRLDIQEKVLRRMDVIYGEVDPAVFTITDRTPLDMLAYTMADAIGNAVGVRELKRFAEYTEKCFEVTNRRFSTLLLVQPGIPIVKARGKAAPNAAYMEHLNSLILGLAVDVRCKVAHYFIARSALTIEERIRSVDSAIMKSTKAAEGSMKFYLAMGGSLQ